MPHYFIRAQEENRLPTDDGNTSLIVLPNITTPNSQNTGAETPSPSSTPFSLPFPSLQAVGEQT